LSYIILSSSSVCLSCICVIIHCLKKRAKEKITRVLHLSISIYYALKNTLSNRLPITFAPVLNLCLSHTISCLFTLYLVFILFLKHTYVVGYFNCVRIVS